MSNSLELARRGFVTLVVDPYNQGESSSQHSDDDDTAVVTAIDYVTDHLDTFNYVDEDRIPLRRRYQSAHGAKRPRIR